MVSWTCSHKRTSSEERTVPLVSPLVDTSQ